jgi:phosphoglycerate dehydrogenase-like enzyme
MMRVAVLDDYQRVALGLADWARLHPAAQIESFDRHIADADELARRLHAFEIIVAMRERTPFPASLFARLPNLRLLVTSGMRNAAIDLAAASAHGVTVCGTDMLGTPTAELTWGLVLGLCRSIPFEDRAMREGKWQTTLGVGVHGKTLGIVGLGKLGSQVAKIGKAFGMEIIAWSQNLTAERAAAAGARLVAKDELFAAADIISIHLVLSPRTRGLVGAAELARMKSSALIVNTSRGPIIDEAALVEALERRRIAGAAIDVYDTEPLPESNRLRRLPNTVVTPHLGYVTEENYRQAYGQAVEDIAAFLAGTPVRVVAAPTAQPAGSQAGKPT